MSDWKLALDEALAALTTLRTAHVARVAAERQRVAERHAARLGRDEGLRAVATAARSASESGPVVVALRETAERWRTQEANEALRLQVVRTEHEAAQGVAADEMRVGEKRVAGLRDGIEATRRNLDDVSEAERKLHARILGVREAAAACAEDVAQMRALLVRSPS